MDADSRSTSGAVEEASPNTPSEDLLWWRKLLAEVLGHPSEAVEDMLRTHTQCGADPLWRLLGEELRREKKGSLLDFYFTEYVPATIWGVPLKDLRSKS